MSKTTTTPESTTEPERNLTRVLIRLTYALLGMVIVLIVCCAAIGLQVTTRNEAIEDVQAEVHDIQDYVDELRQPPTEEDIAQQLAVTQAVRQVPEVKNILCNEFPENAGCQE